MLNLKCQFWYLPQRASLARVGSHMRPAVWCHMLQSCPISILIRVDTILTWYKFTWLLIWMCENCCTIFLSKSAKSVEHFKHFLKWHYNFQQSVLTYRWVCRIGWTLWMLSLKKKKKKKKKKRVRLNQWNSAETTRLWIWLVWSMLSLRPKKSCLVVLHCPPLSLQYKYKFTVQKYTAPNFQNSKKVFLFFSLRILIFWKYF